MTEQEIAELWNKAVAAQRTGYYPEILCEFTELVEKKVRSAWQPIETAPKTGRTLLLGYFNSHGNWRTR